MQAGPARPDFAQVTARFRAVATAGHAAPAAGSVLAAIQEYPAAIGGARASLQPFERAGFEQRDGIARHAAANEIQIRPKTPAKRTSVLLKVGSSQCFIEGVAEQC